MKVHQPLPLLGGLTPAGFMRRHWQKRPLLVRGAMPLRRPPLSRRELFALAAGDGVESRLVARRGGAWTLRHGPLPRRALPPLAQPGWTLLVQGVDLHASAAHELLQRFRFVPDARLDDVMVSYATDGGGVGPHVDSYDVFLLQLQGRRRWRIGPVADAALVDGAPLKTLARFEPSEQWLLEPGDLLYLPPRWGHDGVADGECMTASIGFRAPSRDELARDVLQRLADSLGADDTLYRDPAQAATTTPARLPAALHAFAAGAVERVLARRGALARAIGEALSEPKPQVWFDAVAGRPLEHGVTLDRRTRMMYDAVHLYINGESHRAGGRDATLMRRLADRRRLDASDVARLGDDARALLRSWADAGWLHGE